MDANPGGMLVVNPDELGPDPVPGMDLAASLGVRRLEIRSADGTNALMLSDGRLEEIRSLAEQRDLTVAALASPLWKWCAPQARPGRVDSFGFPTRVASEDRVAWMARAIRVAELLGAGVVRVFSHLRVGPELTESFVEDPLLLEALAMAAGAGVRLLLENEPVCTVAHAESLLEVLECHGASGLGLWLDVANLHEVGQADAATVALLAPYVGYVHVKDYRVDEEGRRVYCPAGTGCVPFGEVMPVLRATGAELPYALETHVREAPVEAITAGADFLRGALLEGRV